MGDRSKITNPFFGKILKQLRTDRGLTQSDIGKVVNKGDSTVRMWELRSSEPDYETIVILANYFGVTVDYLLGREITVMGDDAPHPSIHIPVKYGDVFVALNKGDDLEQDDVDDIIRFIEFKKSTKNK